MGALRILHIASGDLWAGAEVQAFTLICHLAKMPDTEVAAGLMNEGPLAERLRAVGVPVYLMDERQLSPLQILRHLCGILRSWRPDVIHTHREKENILGSIANRLSSRVPCVRTVHGGNEHSAATGWAVVRRGIVTSLDRWCGRALQQKVIAVTKDLGTRLNAKYPARKIVVVENGVDVEVVRAAKGVAGFRMLDKGATHIGIAGRLVQVKRVDLFLDAAALLLQSHPERRWKFHIFGDGPARFELEQYSRQVQIAERIAFHGHREDIATCLGGLDALVICSDHEGLPMVALEAVALGVPTVAHAVGGLADVVPRDFQVFQHDAQGYAEAVLRVLEADGIAITGGHAQETLGNFSAQRNAERVRAVYEQVVDEMNARDVGKSADRRHGARA